MCLGIPGRIIEFINEENYIAKVEVSGVRRNVNVALVYPEGLAVNDWVLIHVGFAMSKIDEEEAHETVRLLQEMGAAYEEELQALHESQIE
jgi:hydrogenase expression/formation protein HypC